MRKRRQPIHKPDKKVLEIYEPENFFRESCMNPWNGKCMETDVALYIIYRGERLPICRKCWGTISSTDIEWDYD
jgi:hypothetical protein